MTYELFSDEVLRRANAIGFGSHQLPTFDLENARYVISFGADFLGTWNSAVAQSVAYGRMRQGGSGARPKFVHVDARLSQTAANADEFVACKPGTEGLLALAIARADRQDAAMRLNTRRRRLPKRPACRPTKIERLAREFAANGPAVAIIGGAPLAHTNGAVPRARGQHLESGRERVNQPGGVSFVPQGAPVATRPLEGDPRRRAEGAADRRCESGLRIAAGVESGRRAEARAVHRQLRIVHRRDQRARGSDPAGSFVPRVVGRCGAGERLGESRAVEVRPGDAAALRHALDAGRVARGVARAREAACRPAEHVRRIS